MVQILYRAPSSSFCAFDNFCTILHWLDPGSISAYPLYIYIYCPHGGLLIDLVLFFQPSSQLFHHLETLITMVSHYHWNGDSHVSLLPIKKKNCLEIQVCWLYQRTLPTQLSLLESSFDCEHWEIWQNKFMEVMEHCIPRGTLPERRNLPWLNKSIVQEIKRRNCLFRKQNCGNDPRLTLKYTRLRNKVAAKLRQAKQITSGS